MPFCLPESVLVMSEVTLCFVPLCPVELLTGTTLCFPMLGIAAEIGASDARVGLGMMVSFGTYWIDAGVKD
jgi:hypothetical protein